MVYMARWKIILNLCLVIVGLALAIPNALSPETRAKLPDFLSHTINLGLDLRGGSHIQFEVDLKAVKKELATNMVEEVRSNLRKEQIGYTGLSAGAHGASVAFQIREDAQREKAIQALKKLDSAFEISNEANNQIVVKYTEQAIQQRMRAVVDQSIEVIRRRVDETGMKEPTILRQGEDRIIVQLPGVDDPAEIKKLIGKTAKLTFRLVDSSVMPMEGQRPSAPVGSEILQETHKDGRTSNVIVKKQIEVSGEHLIDAQATTNENGMPAVSLRFNSIGARKFADMSANNLKKQFAIVLDNTVISAPVFQDVIPNGNGVISGHFTLKEANDLALLLRAGALPAPLKVLEERTIGPSMGADSVKSGQLATTFAIIFVAVFMIMNYSLFGVFADIALVFNLIFLMAALGVLNATLTLPGIAGIALTVGMAVDSNVLIYERIKEEIRAGTKIVTAIEAGYRRAVMTIIDSNVTTLIGGAVLYEFGSGPIRGFAVTLALGILLSMFSTLALNRMIIIFWLRKTKPAKLPI